MASSFSKQGERNNNAGEEVVMGLEAVNPGEEERAK